MSARNPRTSVRPRSAASIGSRIPPRGTLAREQMILVAAVRRVGRILRHELVCGIRRLASALSGLANAIE